MNNLNTRIILINQYFRLFFKVYTPPISNLYICQFSRHIFFFSKLSYNTALLKVLNIEKIEDIVNRNVLSLCKRIFKVESPAQHLLSRFILYGKTIPGTLLDRVVSMGESPTKRAFNSQHIPETSVTNNDGLVDSIIHLLFTDNFTKPYSHEHLLVHLLTTAL